MAYFNFDRLNRRVQLDPKDHLQRLQALNARARIEGPEVFLEVLADRRVWNEMPSSIQDTAIQEVGRRLQEDLTYLNTEVYSCGGQSHRIASFTDKKTGLRAYCDRIFWCAGRNSRARICLCCTLPAP